MLTADNEIAFKAFRTRIIKGLRAGDRGLLALYSARDSLSLNEVVNLTGSTRMTMEPVLRDLARKGLAKGPFRLDEPTHSLSRYSIEPAGATLAKKVLEGIGMEIGIFSTFRETSKRD